MRRESTRLDTAQCSSIWYDSIQFHEMQCYTKSCYVIQQDSTRFVLIRRDSTGFGEIQQGVKHYCHEWVSGLEGKGKIRRKKQQQGLYADIICDTIAARDIWKQIAIENNNNAKLIDPFHTVNWNSRYPELNSHCHADKSYSRFLMPRLYTDKLNNVFKHPENRFSVTAS